MNVSSECSFFLSHCIKYVQKSIGHSLDTALAEKFERRVAEVEEAASYGCLED